MIFNLNVVKARFQMRENYYSIKSRGFLVAEIIPAVQNINDASRKTYQVKDKSSAFINAENIYSLLEANTVNLSYQKDHDTIELNVNEVDSVLEWTFHRSSNDDIKKIRMTKSETFFAREYIKHCVPYVFGWYGLGDPRICEMNLVAEQEIKDPFENI